MELKIIKKGTAISLMDGEQEIESYKFENTIDFSKLIQFLISKELSEKIYISKDLPSDLNQEEKNLCSFISDILEKYNTSVDEFKKFIKAKTEKNKQ